MKRIITLAAMAAALQFGASAADLKTGDGELRRSLNSLSSSLNAIDSGRRIIIVNGTTENGETVNGEIVNGEFVIRDSHQNHTNTVTRTFELGDFNSISAGGLHHIYLKEGKSNRIEVSCSEKTAEHLDYKVAGGVLTMNLDESMVRTAARGGRSLPSITVRIEMTDIRKISLSGAAKLYPKGVFKAGKEVVIELSGAAEIEDELCLSGGRELKCDLTGGTDAEVRGSFEKAEIRISGAGELELEGDVENLDIETNGAAKFDYKGNSRSIDAECSGASEIELEGTTGEIGITTSGAAKADAEEMVAEKARAQATGCSRIKVYTKENGEFESSSLSTIKYYGPAKNISVSNPSVTRGN